MLKLKPIALTVVSAYAVAGCAGFVQRAQERHDAASPASGGQRQVITAEAMYQLGRFYQAQDRHLEAIAAYRDALDRNPGYVEARNGLGVTLAEQRRYDEAIAELKLAIESAPGAAYLRNNLGYVYLLQGANEEAVTAFEEALKLDAAPERAAHFNLRLAHERMGKAEVSQHAVASPDLSVVESRPTESKAAQSDEPGAGARRSTLTLVQVAPSVYVLQGPGVSEKPPVAADLPAATATPVATATPAAIVTPVAAVTPVATVTPVAAVTPVATVTLAATATPAAAEIKPFKLEVSNGNGVTGMAARVARLLGHYHIPTGRLTNDGQFQQPKTYIQYREGYESEAALLGKTLLKPIPTEQTSELRSDIQVRLVLGHDVRHEAALLDFRAPDAQVVADVQSSTAE